ncbi:MAG TPA: bifunctional nuclease domain-containing protein, partial [Candidatus Sulfotelmatobacter sp.]|nr:bifunctional nuclease domain-containing protein [Candidatus Sulfotelmatobacter sp.]
RTVDVDARSSDAIALALRAGVVIYATDDVLERAGVTPSEADAIDEERLAVFREFVNSLDWADPPEGESES